MREDVKNNQCQICKGYLFEEDDIVVCPHCGAPHHRDCWQTVGHCGAMDFHGTDKQYDLLKRAERSESETDAEPEVHTCPRCHRTSKSQGAEFCPYCGQPYNGSGQGNPHAFPGGAAHAFDPYGGLPKNTTIDGVRVEDIATFVGNNSPRYINRFSVLNKNRKGSWNWAAFLFPAGWCMSRKMFPAGILYLILEIAATLCMLPFMETYSELMVDQQLNSYEIYDYILANLGSFSLTSVLLLFLGAAIFFVPRIICGRLGDWHYKCFATEKIKKILDDPELEDKEYSLRRAGNVNVLLLAAAYFAVQWLPMLIFSLL